MEELEDIVKDAILEGGTQDRYLANLISIAIMKLEGERLWDNLLDAPAFFTRFFLKWVEEGLEEYKKAADLAPPKPGGDLGM